MNDRTIRRFRAVAAGLALALPVLSFAPSGLAQKPAEAVTDAELDRPLLEPPKEPSAETRRRGVELYNEGLALAQQGKSREALRAFRRAYEQDGSSDSMANIAVLEMALGKPRAAAEHLSTALERLPLLESAMQANLKQRLAEAKKRVGTVDLAIEVVGSDVQWNAVWLGTGPVKRPVYVEPGSEQMLVVRHNGVEHRRKIVLARGETLRIVLTPDDFPGAAPAQTAPSTKEAPPSSAAASGERLPWLLGGVGLSVVFAGVAAGGFGAMAVADGERSKIERDIGKLGGFCTPKPLVGFADDCHARDQEAGNQSAGLAVGITGAALAVTAAAVTLGFALKVPAQRVTLAPGPGGLWISGKF